MKSLCFVRTFSGDRDRVASLSDKGSVATLIQEKQLWYIYIHVCNVQLHYYVYISALFLCGMAKMARVSSMSASLGTTLQSKCVIPMFPIRYIPIHPC